MKILHVSPHPDDEITGAGAAGRMLLGAPRRLDLATPLAPPSAKDLTPWLHARSLRDQLRRP